MSKDKLQQLIKEGNKSEWLNNVLFRKKNNKWLNYSSQIARRIMAKIDEDKDLTQVEIARRMEVSAQQVNKIIKGQENLTLETIANLSTAIGFELITFPEYNYSSVTDNYSETNITDIVLSVSVNQDKIQPPVVHLMNMEKMSNSNQSAVVNF